MHTNPPVFAELLNAAAESVEAQTKHPGQIAPGYWQVGGQNTAATLIGVIAAGALARVCREQDADLDLALRSYMEVAKNVPLVVKGTPDQMAARHLRDTGDEVLRSEADRKIAV
jgi:hypothetical protein